MAAFIHKPEWQSWLKECTQLKIPLEEKPFTYNRVQGATAAGHSSHGVHTAPYVIRFIHKRSFFF